MSIRFCLDVPRSQLLSSTEQVDDAIANRTAWPKKHNLFGLYVSAVEYDQAVDCILHAAIHRNPSVVSCHAVHAIVTLSSDRDLCELANRFSMITPDGQPVKWALNALYGTRLRERVYGPELMWRVLRESEKRGLAVYLYGGSVQTLEALKGRIRKVFPSLRIAGAMSPPFRQLSDQELEIVADDINQSGAEIVFIGLGCPKQDKFAASQSPRIRGVQICVGAAFDFQSGSKPMAPRWMQSCGTEWLFRLACEPRRLFARYLTTNSIFVIRFLKALIFKS